MDMDNILENLRGRGYDAVFFRAAEEAAAHLTESIKDKDVGIGGSVTLKQLDIYDTLKERNRSVTWHWVEGDREGAKRRAARAGVYLMSCNAIAETGEIINIDGIGNRVTTMLYGPEQVYIVAGINKFAPDERAALHRARNVAAPKNAVKLGVNTPCADMGDRCYDCDSPERICRGLVTLWRKPAGIEKMEIVIVGQELGL